MSSLYWVLWPYASRILHLCIQEHVQQSETQFFPESKIPELVNMSLPLNLGQPAPKQEGGSLKGKSCSLLSR